MRQEEACTIAVGVRKGTTLLHWSSLVPRCVALLSDGFMGPTVHLVKLPQAQIEPLLKPRSVARWRHGRLVWEKIEEDGPVWRSYYLNSTQHPPTDAQVWITSRASPQTREPVRSVPRDEGARDDGGLELKSACR